MKKIVLTCLFLFSTISAFPQPYCLSFQGIPVTYVADTTLETAGSAYLKDGQPFIAINPNIVNALPAHVQQFWYAHECAHHALHPTQNSEVNADCYAIKRIRNLGIITNFRQIDNLLHHISTLSGSIQTGHLPGPERAQHLYSCFVTP